VAPEDVLLAELVEFGVAVDGHDVDDRNEGDFPSRAAAIVSSLKADGMVIVYGGTVWDLAPIG
jgi:hypothetical protein